MSIRKSDIVLIAIVLLSFILGLCFYPHMPDKMATHWNAKGQVDGYMPKFWGLFLTPLILTSIVVLFKILLLIDPLKENIKKFRIHYDGFIVIVCIFILYLEFHTILWNLGIKVGTNRFVSIAIGLLLFYSGILCEKAKRNWFIGVKTPWTLSSDIVWEKTNKLGGKLLKVIAIIIPLAIFFFPNSFVPIILIPVILATVYLVIYSYVIYQKLGEDDTLTQSSENILPTSSGNKQWDKVKTDYLRQVKKILSSVKASRRIEILEDVSSHLDARFAELKPEQQSWENFQKIIAEMGPPSDYAELLGAGQAPEKQTVSNKFLLSVILALIAITAAMIILPMALKKGEKAYQLEEIFSAESLPHPFENDQQIIGVWKSVDFVRVLEQFQPDYRAWKGDLFLKDLRFMKNGLTSTSMTWTKDWIYHSNGKTKAQYKIKQMAGQTYLFLPWLSGDVTIRGQKPSYYVLKKESKDAQE